MHYYFCKLNLHTSGSSSAPTERLVITKTFPQKLMEVIDDPITDAAIWWLPEGESFVIRPKEFNETLDSCFQGSKLFSFTRKLYRYGFRKIITSQECAVEDLVFSHPCFQKGKPQLLHYVTGSNKHTMYSSQAIQTTKSYPVKTLSTNKVSNPGRLEKRQMVANFSSARPPVRVTPTFTANSMASSVLPRNFPSLHHQQQLQSTSSNPALVSAMMLRGPVGNANSMRAVFLARGQPQHQRLQQACLMVPQQAPRGIQLVRSLPGVNQSQLLDFLIRKRLSELQGQSHLSFP